MSFFSSKEYPVELRAQQTIEYCCQLVEALPGNLVEMEYDPVLQRIFSKQREEEWMYHFLIFSAVMNYIGLQNTLSRTDSQRLKEATSQKLIDVLHLIPEAKTIFASYLLGVHFYLDSPEETLTQKRFLRTMGDQFLRYMKEDPPSEQAALKVGFYAYIRFLEK